MGCCPSRSRVVLPHGAGDLRAQGSSKATTPVAALDDFDAGEYGSGFLSVRKGDFLLRVDHPGSGKGWIFATRVDQEGWIPEWLIDELSSSRRAGGCDSPSPPRNPSDASPSAGSGTGLLSPSQKPERGPDGRPLPSRRETVCGWLLGGPPDDVAWALQQVAVVRPSLLREALHSVASEAKALLPPCDESEPPDSPQEALATWAPAAATTPRGGQERGPPPPPPGACPKEEVTELMRAQQRRDPGRWTLTLGQWFSIIAYCRALPEYHWVKREKGVVTMHDISRICIKPWTATTGCSLAVLMNGSTARSAKLVLSHAWGEDIEECQAAVEEYTLTQGIDKQTPIWFCAFANYQADDGMGPSVHEQVSMMPFMEVIGSKGVRREHGGYGLCAVHTSQEDFYGRLWCVHEVEVAMRRGVKAGAAMSKEYVHNVVQRLSIFVEAGFDDNECIEAAGLRVHGINATCSDMYDQRFLIRSTLDNGGFELLDDVVTRFRLESLPAAIVSVLTIAKTRSADRDVRQSALEALPQEMQGDEHAIDAVVRCLEDDDVGVRRAAVEASSKVALRGDERLVSALVALTDHPDAKVRWAAVGAMMQVAEENDERLLIAVARGLDEESGGASPESGQLTLLRAPAGEGDARIHGREQLETVLRGMEHEDEGIRRAAIRAVLQAKGDERLITGVAERLEHNEAYVRWAAVEVLPQIAALGDARLVAAVAQRLRHPDPEVRRAAVEALSRVHHGGECFDTLQECFEDEAVVVRVAAVRAMPSVARKGDVRPIAAVAKCLQDRDAMSRKAALQVMPLIAHKSDITLIQAVTQCLEDPDALVRRLAMEMLPEIAEKGDRLLVTLVAQRLEHDEPSVRWAVAEVLPTLAEKGDSRLFAAVAARLEHRDPRVRRAAVELLPRICSKGDDRLIAAMTRRLEDQHADVKRAVVQALPQVAEKGDSRLISSVTKCLEHDDASVRWAAVEAMLQVAVDTDERLISVVTKGLQGKRIEVDLA